MAQNTIDPAPGDPRARIRGALSQARPIRSENRALLVASIARGRRWLYELAADAEHHRRGHRSTRGLQCAQSQHDDLACLPRARPRQGGDRRTSPAWDGRGADFANCPPNGRASTAFSVSTRRSRDFEPVSAPHGLCFPGNGISRPETKAPKQRSWTPVVSSGDRNALKKPAKCGLFERFQEISVSARVRGGARSQMRTCLRKRQRSLTGKNTANFAIVGRRAGLAEARSRRFMGSSTTIPRDEEQRFDLRKSSDHAHFCSDLPMRLRSANLRRPEDRGKLSRFPV